MTKIDNTQKKLDIVGKLSFLGFSGDVGEVVEYTSSDKYLNAIKEELNNNPDGFRHETVLRDPKLLKEVDDLFYDVYGADNPKSIQSYIERVNKESGNSQMSKNLSFLKNQLRYLGFGDSAIDQLSEKLYTGIQNFSIVVENRPVSPDIKENQYVKYILDFDKSKASGNYFLNSYTAKLQEEKNDVAEHKFFVNNGNGFTAKEAFNLLSGRAVNKDIVNKEGNKVNVWMKLNPEQEDGGPKLKYFNRNYGFDLEKAVDDLKVKFSDTFTKESVLKSLEKGNLQSVVVERNNKHEQIYIASNPQYKKLDLYSKDLDPVFVKSEKVNNNPWEGGPIQEKKAGISR